MNPVEVLAEALSADRPLSMTLEQGAEAILAASPALSDALALGLVWQEAEDIATQQGKRVSVLRVSQGRRPHHSKYEARAWSGIGHGRQSGYGPTPALSLGNLIERLKA